MKHYLSSKDYIPKGLIGEIDRKTSWLMESGLHHFYETFDAFCQKLQEKIRSNYFDEDDIQPITLQHMMGPFKSCICLFLLALIILVIEISVHKYNNMRRNRRIGSRISS